MGEETTTSIVTRYLGPTNCRSACIVADAGMGRRVTISYPHGLNTDRAHRAAAVALCVKFDWHGTLVQGGRETGCAFVFAGDPDDTFAV